MRGYLGLLALTAILAGGVAPAAAESLKVRRLELARTGENWTARVGWRVPWRQDPYREVHQGVPIDFTVELELFRQRGWWYDASLGVTRVRREVYYNRLTRQYRVIDWSSQDRYFTRDWDRARDLVQRSGPVELVAEGRLNPGSDYYVGVRVAASREHLSLPARIMATFTSFWGASSEWRYRSLDR